METYRELFEFADGTTLLQLLERKPDFPYDEEIVQALSKRTDLPEAIELLNIFEKKKAAIKENVDVFDFAVSVERAPDDEKGEETRFFLEYFKKYSGWYLRRRYPLQDINEKMMEKSTLPPAMQFRRALEETVPESEAFDRSIDYKPTPPTSAEARALLSGKHNSISLKKLNSHTFYYVDSKNCNKCHAYEKPYTLKDMQYEFKNRNISVNSEYPKVYHHNSSDSKIQNLMDYCKQYNLITTNNIQLTFYMHNLLSTKLINI